MLCCVLRLLVFFFNSNRFIKNNNGYNRQLINQIYGFCNLTEGQRNRIVKETKNEDNGNLADKQRKSLGNDNTTSNRQNTFNGMPTERRRIFSLTERKTSVKYWGYLDLMKRQWHINTMIMDTFTEKSTKFQQKHPSSFGYSSVIIPLTAEIKTRFPQTSTEFVAFPVISIFWVYLTVALISVDMQRKMSTEFSFPLILRHCSVDFLSLEFTSQFCSDRLYFDYTINMHTNDVLLKT